jgi:hypothetical protein
MCTVGDDHVNEVDLDHQQQRFEHRPVFFEGEIRSDSSPEISPSRMLNGESSNGFTMRGLLGWLPIRNVDAPETDGAAHATHPTQCPPLYPDVASPTTYEHHPTAGPPATIPQSAIHRGRSAAASAAAPSLAAACDASPLGSFTSQLGNLAVLHGPPTAFSSFLSVFLPWTHA